MTQEQIVLTVATDILAALDTRYNCHYLYDEADTTEYSSVKTIRKSENGDDMHLMIWTSIMSDGAAEVACFLNTVFGKAEEIHVGTKRFKKQATKEEIDEFVSVVVNNCR